MNRRLQEIRRRQDALVGRAAAQRQEIARIASGWHQPLRIVDEVMSTVRRLRFHPVLAAVGQTLLLTVAPRYRVLLLWAGRAFVGWEVYRTVRELLPRDRSVAGDTPAPDAERVD